MGYEINKMEEIKEIKEKLKIEEDEESIIMENEQVKYTFSKKELNFNLYDKIVERTVITEGNQFIIHEDIPLFWDAWY
jgi:alpha-mannosidase